MFKTYDNRRKILRSDNVFKWVILRVSPSAEEIHNIMMSAHFQISNRARHTHLKKNLDKHSSFGRTVRRKHPVDE
jgi:hypothetical protein